eukprot:TRINITY_DN110_c0_g2_i2.p1 TRINITY_DN110_c0_g2~~TRINITY_DN110_c0_g2_i2.p1  ORF type:complete len:209 (-),score=44.31 TRINITY_DN110_c0_g2_i2:44-670(-)
MLNDMDFAYFEGKSNLINRYTKDTFNIASRATIGVEFGHKTIVTEDDQVIKVQIWDTAGQERYRALTRGYYRGAVGALVVFSVQDRGSFEKCNHWFEELSQYSERDTFKLLIGNKSDLEREVSQEEAMKYAEDNGVLYMETSALDNSNVTESFEYAIFEIYKITKEKENTDDEVRPKFKVPKPGSVIIPDSDASSKENNAQADKPCCS